MKRISIWLFSGVMVVAIGACAPAPEAAEPETVPVETPAPPLRDAVETHLAAIPARDLDALLATVTTGNELTLIFPDGEKLDTRQQFVDFHKQWFDDDSWKFQSEIVDLIEAPTLGRALVRYRYDATNEDGSPRSNTSWLALTFALEQGQWRPVFDQNTRITASP